MGVAACFGIWLRVQSQEPGIKPTTRKRLPQYGPALHLVGIVRGPLVKDGDSIDVIGRRRSRAPRVVALIQVRVMNHAISRLREPAVSIVLGRNSCFRVIIVDPWIRSKRMARHGQLAADLIQLEKAEPHATIEQLTMSSVRSVCTSEP